VNLERERLVLQHLESALEWPPEERDGHLERALGHDPTLLSDVRELLAMSENVGVSMPTEIPVAPVPDDAPPPERLGPYRLRELLGTGGMGRVYRAERADGLFEQTIAIKLMRRTRLPAQVAAQFARERQILARFQHPNIAQLFDGGLTPEGLSYFVMELVEGRPISEFAADEKLGLRPLLLLFRQVCSAVQYAHAHLVVHADLKPTNIMVTKEGTAKLLDFGVARVLQEADEAASTEPSSLGITVYYASPARRRGEPPTVVDDVYSLGVLMKDLLRRFDVVPRDLTSIANQASADDPAVRYGSVDALKSDIERWLDGLPVRAHGPAWTYIASKYFARHRFAVTAASASVVLLAVAAVALGVLYVREQRATDRAERRFAEVSELSRYVLFDVYDTLESIPRALTLRRDLAQKGQHYLDQLSRDAAAPTDVRLDVIEGLRRLALVQGDPSTSSLQQVPVARSNLARAEELARALSTEGAEGRERRLALARLAVARSRILIGMNLDVKDASRVLDEGEAQLEPLMRARDPAAVPLKLDLASERALALQWDGKYAESIEVARKAMQIPDADLDGSPEKRRAALRRRVRLLDIFAEGHYYTNEIDASVAPYRESLAIVRDLAKEEPLSLSALRMVSRSEWALGAVLIELSPPQAKEAEQLLAAALQRSKELRVLEPANKEAIRTESVFASTYAQALGALGRLDEAESRLKDAVQTRFDLWQASPENWGIARDYVISVWALGDTQIRRRATGRACDSYAIAVDMLERMRKAERLTKLDEETTLRPIQEKVAQYCEGKPSIAGRPGSEPRRD
jgi:eukaryotic-like serine/threonine-protein kinase